MSILSARVTLLAIEVGITQERSSGSSERHHWKRDWDGNIDSNLTNINLLLELPGSGSIVGEDGSSIAIGIPEQDSNDIILIS